MKTPKFTIIITAIATFLFLIQDSLSSSGVNYLEFFQDSAFIGLGSVMGIFFLKSKENKKPELIDSNKLALEVAEDEKKQLQEKIKTLEAALERLIK